MDVDINYLAVFLAAASSMVVGAIWYSKSAFGSTWAKLVKLSDKEMGEMAPRALAIAFLSSLITAYVIAHVTFLSHRFFITTSWFNVAVSTAVLLWLGLTAARFITHDGFERRRKKLTLINIGNELATILVMGIIIGLLQP